MKKLFILLIVFQILRILFSGFLTPAFPAYGEVIKVTQAKGLSVALPGETLTLSVTLSPYIMKKSPHFITLKVIDHKEEVLLEKKVNCAGKQNLTIPLNIKKFGYFRVYATVSNDKGNVIKEDETSFAIIPDVELNAPTPDSPFGIGAYYVVRFNPQELEIATQLQRRMGAAWDRDELLWDLCEPEPGKWQWERFDRSVEACRKNNILIIGLLDYWGKWAKPLTEEGYKSYANYVRTMVRRFRPGGEFARLKQWQDDYGIRHWEIWNEPATFWTGTGTQFGTLLKYAYQAVKKVDPKAFVFFDNWGEQFDTDVIATAGRDSFDGVAPHYYCPPRSPEEGELDKLMERTIAFYRNQGIKRPFWITEMGWQSDNTLIRQNEQARFLVRSYVMALASGMNKIFWYNFVNDGRDKNRLEFGLVNREDFTPKVGYPAYAGMVKRLYSARFVARVPTPRPVRIYIFRRGPTSVAVLWSLKTEGKLLTKLKEKECKLFDIMGNVIQPERTAPDSILLPLSPEPLYLESELPPQELVKRLQKAELKGIALLNMKILPLLGSLDKGSSVCVEIENYSQKPVTGNATISAPTGWVAKHTALKFAPIPPAGKITLCFRFLKCQRRDDNLYPVKITVITDDKNKMTASEELSELVATYGHPVVDGNLNDWQNVRWVYLNRESQAIGLQPYADWNLSAKIATQWNEKGFYFAAIVADNDFHQPYSGDLVWMGDNFQLAFDTTLNRGKNPAHPGDYLYGLSLTDKGVEVFRWRGGNSKPSLIKDANLKILKTPEGKLHYECFFPAHLLKPMKFAEGTRFGFSFILNDNDGGGRRGWLEWTPGIGTGYSSKFFTTWTLTK